VNFVTEQVNEDVKLPESQSAAPMNKADTDVLFVNLKPFFSREFMDRVKDPGAMAQLQQKFRENDPCYIIVGKDPMTFLEWKFWLKNQFEDIKKTSKDNKLNTKTILRADERIDYVHIYRTLQTVKELGGKHISTREMMRNAPARKKAGG